MQEQQLVIWDFDGVLCDSLFECMTVTRVAAFQIDNPGINVTRENLHEICNHEVIALLYEKMCGLRPFIVRGQDYLWQYYCYDSFSGDIPNFRVYRERFDRVFDAELDKAYENTFYQARRLLADLMGQQYFTLFKPYSAALYAFRVSQRWYKNYICTARDQRAVQLLFGDKAIEFPVERIFSKDFNGRKLNSGLTKTEQILDILDREGGRDRSFLIIEDQVKAPAELRSECKNMKVVCAEYGYGLQCDWEEADIPDLKIVSNPAELVHEIY